MATPTAGAIPVLILREDASRERGRQVLHSNVSAADALAEIVRTTLGPRGMNKLMVDSLGDIIITNDGATILDELDVAHPTAKLIVQASKSQDYTAGDGTTSVVVLIGEFLSKADKLVDKGIHPIIITAALKKIRKKLLEFLDELAWAVDIEKDKETLINAAISALNSKLPEAERKYFAELAYEAAIAAYDKERNYLDPDLINIIQKEGKTLTDTILVKGVAIDKKVVHPEMPKIKKEARIALIDQNIEVEKADVTSNVTVDSIEAFEELRRKERELIREMVQKLIDLKVDVVFCQRGISDQAQDILAKNGIMAVRRVRRKDMRLISRATGAKIVSNIEDLHEDDIGYAGLVYQKKVGEDQMVFVEKPRFPGATTIIVRGASKHITDEAERALQDAINVLKDILEDKKVVGGAGATLMALAVKLREWAEKTDELNGKEKEVARAFSVALEAVPRALVENAGEDVIDVLSELRRKTTNEPGEWGFDAIDGKVVRVKEKGLIDPYRVISNIITTAIETSTTVLRIDEIIASKPKEEKKGPKGPGGEGMGPPPQRGLT